MTVYKFKIREVVQYEQNSTVIVEASSLEEAARLVRHGEYEPTGDNIIDLNTENVQSITIEEYLNEKV